MKSIHRRSFIGQMSVAAGALLLPKFPIEILNAAKPLNIPIGFQTFPIRNMLAKDFTGTLKMMAAQGYQLTEMCSPKGYASIGYGPLVGMSTSDMKNTIRDSGLSCPSCHFGFGEFNPDQLDERIEWSHNLGLTQMICSTFWLPKTATISDYQAAADKLNKAAEKIKQAGMQTGFHNHEFEFNMLENQLIYDVLMARLDPNLVKMQFQTEVINLGYKASDYFKKYPGRFISSHLSDWTADKKEVPVGQGVIDWKEFFTAAKTGGVKNFFVEMSLENMKGSVDYIRSLKLSA